MHEKFDFEEVFSSHNVNFVLAVRFGRSGKSA